MKLLDLFRAVEVPKEPEAPAVLAATGSPADQIEELTFDELAMLDACVKNATFVAAVGKVMANQMRLRVSDMRANIRSMDLSRAARSEGAVSAFETVLHLLRQEASKYKVSRE